jgi:regulation of enolase protein 1 (concanavalin A-like superfamily)
MSPHWILIGQLAFTAAAGDTLFRDDFKGRLADGWSWVREDKSAWRTTDRGLELRLQPGNMWGPPNNAKNVLVRPAPTPGTGNVEVSVTIENRPTEQYEQVDLVWYYDDSHMVKIGQELVDGKLSLVMGREEGDRCRTIAILPIRGDVLQVKFRVQGNRIRGQYRASEAEDWKDAGECDLPAKGAPKLSLQAYQGPARIERWARLTAFQVKTVE